MLWSVLLIPSALGLAGRGPSSALTLTAFRSSIAHPLHFAGNITLWCAPDNPVVTIRKGYFLRKKDNKKLEAKLSFNKKNATLELNSPNVYDAGEYICELETEHGRVSHKINVYTRPVALTDTEHFTVKGEKEYHLEGAGQYVQRGQPVNITCPVFGHPPPSVKWTKNLEPLELSEQLELDGNSIKIKEADYSHSGSYSCEAVNEYTANGKTNKPLIIIDKMLDVKSELAWVWPLALILIILALLFIIIVLCEIRKKKQDRQSRYITQE